jgi:hypothetical protein
MNHGGPGRSAIILIFERVGNRCGPFGGIESKRVFSLVPAPSQMPITGIPGRRFEWVATRQPMLGANYEWRGLAVNGEQAPDDLSRRRKRGRA